MDFKYVSQTLVHGMRKNSISIGIKDLPEKERKELFWELEEGDV